ncbi:MAG: FHA domain-containing protein [Fimbriimonadaceae bacterium]
MSSVATSIAIFLIALAAALGFLYFALRWVGKNEDQTRAALSKVGLQPLDPIVPDDPPTSAPMAPISPPAPIIQTPTTPILSHAPVVPTRVPALTSNAGQRFELANGTNVVSREAGEICLLGEQTVSRQHAQVNWDGAKAVVRDLGSTNGTFVNGVRIQSDTPLVAGDTIQFGAVMCRFDA